MTAEPNEQTPTDDEAPPGEQPQPGDEVRSGDESAADEHRLDAGPPPGEEPRSGRRWVPWLWRVPAAVLAVTLTLVLPLRWLAPPTTAFIELYGGPDARERYTWTDWEDISPELAIAVVASEDQRFPTHHGLDLEAIRDALDEGDRRRGASTISQQVAKNLYLWAGRSWVRKGLEAYLTLAIEALWPKRRILEVYLNVAEFGPGTFGVGAASAEFFGITPAALGRRQAALLAVVLPSPRRMSPARPSRYMEQRAAWVMDQIRLLGGPAYLDRIR